MESVVSSEYELAASFDLDVKDVSRDCSADSSPDVGQRFRFKGHYDEVLARLQCVPAQDARFFLRGSVNGREAKDAGPTLERDVCVSRHAFHQY